MSHPLKNNTMNIERTVKAFSTLHDSEPHPIDTHALNGTQGTNRERHRPCQIRAQNDVEAMHCWLEEYAHKATTTARLYQKEAERCLLWCLFQRHKAFSSCDTEDFRAYFHFLKHPEPKHLWCAPPGGRGKKRGHPDWRPFTGPLSASSRATAITVIHSLVTYLVDAQYLAYDPIKLMRKKHQQDRRDVNCQQMSIKQRILTLDEWQAILTALENLPDTKPHQRDEKERLHFIVHSLYFLGIRVSELVSHTWRSYRQEDARWWFYVIGKGDKVGKIPVNDTLMASVRRYRQYLHFSDIEPTPEDDGPLVFSWRTGQALSARFINTLLKRLAHTAANTFSDQPEKAQKLKKFSAHWLRHLSASMQDQAGIQFKHIKNNLRHGKDDTTRLYVHAFDQERHEEMQKLALINAPHDRTD